MNVIDDRKRIKEHIFEFFNKEWQYHSWFSKECWYDPTEQISDFFDGLWIRSYIKASDNTLNSEEKLEMKKLITLLDNLIDKHRDEQGNFYLDADEMYYRSDYWENIRLQAKIVYDLMNLSDKSK